MNQSLSYAEIRLTRYLETSAWKDKEGEDVELHTKKKDIGEWDGWTIESLKAKLESLRSKKKRSKKEQKLVKQILFAIRAKQKDKFGPVDK
jgi:CRP-like cAMP-binding protein